jgi:hypothetical protein
VRHVSPAASISIFPNFGKENEMMAHKRLLPKRTSLKRLGRRGLSLLLSTVMALSLVQISAFAGTTQNSSQQIKQNQDNQYLYATFDDETGLQIPGGEVTTATKTLADGVTMTKRIAGVPNMENTFDITLEVTTKEELKEFTDVSGANVVLVFDASTSMDDTVDNRSPESSKWRLADTRWTALKKAADSFLEKLLPQGNTKNQVSIVVYGGSNPDHDDDLYQGRNWYVLCDWTTSAATAKASYSPYKVVCQNYAGKQYTGVEDHVSLRKAIFGDPGTNYGATNCQAGFRGAISQWNALKGSDPTSYQENAKYTVFMSDGNANRSYSNSGEVSSKDVVSRTQAEAGKLKSQHSDMTLYTIGFGVNEDSETVQSILFAAPPSSFSGPTFYGRHDDDDDDDDDYHGPRYNPYVDDYYSAENSDKLEIVFENIVKRIQVATEAWIVTDPLSDVMLKAADKVTGENLGGNSYFGYDPRTGTLTWDLRADMTYTTSNSQDPLPGGGTVTTTYYNYSQTYRVQLNSGLCAPGQNYLTNKATKLVYALHDSEGNLDTEVREAYFNVPQVHALFGTLTFEKSAYHDHDLHIESSFKLTHASDCTCGVNDGRYITSTYNAANGRVTLSNIPSGHTYVLEETSTDPDYQVSDRTYQVSVSWQNATVLNPDDKITSDNQDKSIFDGDLFLNKMDPDEMNLEVTKNWLPTSAGANTDRISILVEGTIQLDSQTKETVHSQIYEVTGRRGDSEWKATIGPLPTVDPETGLSISYTVSEVPNSSYKITQIGAVQQENGKLTVSLTNQILDRYPITVSKNWGTLDSAYYSPVTIGLFADGQWIKDITLDQNGWSEEVTVDRYDGNDEIVYTVAEKDPATNTYLGTGATVVLGGTTFTVAVDNSTYTVTNTPVQDYAKSLSGEKQWVDGNNENNTRPTSVQVDLIATVGGASYVVDTKTVSGSAPDNWGYSWLGLPKFAVQDARDTTGVLAKLQMANCPMSGGELIYSVKEHAVPNGYTSRVEGTNIINTISDINDPVEIDVTKQWVDDDNAADTRPEDGITLILSGDDNNSYRQPFAKNDFYSTDGVVSSKETKTLSVPKYTDDGHEIVYEISESGVTNGKLVGKDGVKYSVTYRQEDYTVINSLNRGSDTVTLRVQKDWVDNGNADNTRPATLDVTVGGVTVTLDGVADDALVDGCGEATPWVAQFTLPRFGDDGKEIQYAPANVTESSTDAKLSNYQPGQCTVDSTSHPSFNYAFVLTNRLVQQYLSIQVDKTWQTATGIPADWTGFAANAGTPDSVTVNILGDGKTYPVVLSASNTPTPWSATQENLPKYDSNGKVIVYTVSEVTVGGYTVSGGTLTPVLDGQGLPTGNYTVSLVNTFNQQTTSISGTKEWHDGNSAENRPASILVGLYANNTLVATTPVSAGANGKWEFSFSNLPVYSDWSATGNTTITYKVREMLSDGVTAVEEGGSISYTSPADQENYTYDVSYVGNNIHNTRTSSGGSGKVQLSVNKVWVGPATSSVSFGLYQNGTLIDTISGDQMVAQLSNENIWTASFPQQDKFDASGAAYRYEVKELGDEDATVTANGSQQDITIGGQNYTASGTVLGNTYVFTNTVEQDTVSISGEKFWVNADGKQPASIQVELYDDSGSAVNLPNVTNPVKVVVDDNGSWSYTFENLPKYALDNNGDGHEIVYGVREVGADASGTVKYGDHYFTVSGGTQADNYNLTNTYKTSDVYKYYVVVNYVTHYSDGSADTIEGEITYQDLTEISGGSTASVTPPASLSYGDNTYTYDADNAGNLTSVVVTTPGTYKLVLWYERTQDVDPEDPGPGPGPGGDSYYYRVDYVYTGYDAEGNEIYSDEVTGSVKVRGSSSYSFTASSTTRHDGYDFYLVGDSEFSADLSGTTRSNPYVFTVYYEFTNLEDEETPTTDKPGTDPGDPGTPGDPGDGIDLPDEGVPTTDLPDEDVPKAEVPATGDSLGAWILAAAVSGIGLVWIALTGKKREDDVL